MRVLQAANLGDWEDLKRWNLWLSALRDTEELRRSTWQVGRSLIQLLGKLAPSTIPLATAVRYLCNYMIAFAIA
jgi:urease accessory protein